MSSPTKPDPKRARPTPTPQEAQDIAKELVSKYKRPHVIFGTMTFGTGVGGRIQDRDLMRKILDTVKAHGHFELDTARMYCDGNTEEVLAELQVTNGNGGFHIHTKAYPFSPGDHEPAKIRAQFEASLKALGTSTVDVFYLHAPDHTVPFEKTLEEVQKMYEEGKFRELGVSNYAAWEVMQIYKICESKGWVKPTLYQGMYNALTRDVESELLPCLKELGMRFYAYNPLCGGLLSGHHQFNLNPESGSRFDPSTSQGERYRGRYWNTTYFEAVESLKEALSKHGSGISLASAAHRWMFHHSKLDAAKGDGVVIGASSLAHVEMNLKDCEDGPLDKEIVDAFDRAYAKTKSIQTSYFR
ncbi:hypothetical protein HDV05_002279 [Chytridiales sp. JEL 0842]|nr:hypothetical protein HDV05_002279 [Chytridiales sp. JEL 0842]